MHLFVVTRIDSAGGKIPIPLLKAYTQRQRKHNNDCSINDSISEVLNCQN